MPSPRPCAVSTRSRPGADDDFRVQTQDDLIATRTQATQTMTSLLAGIAGVSLLVGGIGIMNIMLVSVTERTREIGLRLAIGASGSDVLMQFLVEAVVISLVGGLPRHRGLGCGVARVTCGSTQDSPDHGRHGCGFSAGSASSSASSRRGRRPGWIRSTPCDSNRETYGRRSDRSER